MRRLWFALILALCPIIAQAQGAATLVADNITLNGQDQLIASGNVEVFYAGTQLTATAVIYDQHLLSILKMEV